jgi:hypothetical protein
MSALSRRSLSDPQRARLCRTLEQRAAKLNAEQRQELRAVRRWYADRRREMLEELLEAGLSKHDAGRVLGISGRRLNQLLQ